MSGVKSIALTITDHPFPQRMAREMRILSSLRHPNIIPFLGSTTEVEDRGYLALIFPWQPNGLLKKYIVTKPDYDAIKIVSCSMTSYAR